MSAITRCLSGVASGLVLVIGVIFVTIYASQVHWAIAPAYLLTIPLLGGLSSILSKKIKDVQKAIFAETTALAGSTTESLRNIELVKSLGLAKQEIARLNSTTAKILKLELKKVRYLRSLSFTGSTEKLGNGVRMLRPRRLLSTGRTSPSFTREVLMPNDSYGFSPSAAVKPRNKW